MKDELEYSKEQIYNAIDQTLTILENNFRYSWQISLQRS